MSKYLKLIWFAEAPWTKYHAAVGIKAKKTVCGIRRLPFLDKRGLTAFRITIPSNQKLPSKDTPAPLRGYKCLKCLAALRHRYGYEDVREVKIE